VTPELTAVLGQSFSTRWIFDVEMFARMKCLRSSAMRSALREAIYEFPLDAWRDVAGSNVKGRDFAKASLELARIYWRYLRPGASYNGAADGSDLIVHEPADKPGQKAA
jgi:hypothetical protein